MGETNKIFIAYFYCLRWLGANSGNSERPNSG
jgi:hypothetical protein